MIVGGDRTDSIPGDSSIDTSSNQMGFNQGGFDQRPPADDLPKRGEQHTPKKDAFAEDRKQQNSPRTLYEKLQHDQFTSRNSPNVSKSSTHGSQSNRSQYIDIAALPRPSRSTESYKHRSEVGIDVKSPRITPAMSHDDLSALACRDYFKELSPGRISASSSDCPFPVIRRQKSATCVELESVGRTNIVSTVKQFFEVISASSTLGSRPSNKVSVGRSSGRARSRSALGIVTVTSVDEMTDETGSSDDHRRMRRQSMGRRLAEIGQLSKTAPTKTAAATSGVCSLPVSIIKSPDALVSHHYHSAMSGQNGVLNDVSSQVEMIEKNLALAHGRLQVRDNEDINHRKASADKSDYPPTGMKAKF